MIYKSEEEVILITESAMLVSKTLAYLASILKPGITTLDLDKYANTFIRDHQAVPSFYKYNGFPANICTSVNDVVVHGLPNNNPLKEGDVVSIDIGAYKNGFHGDQAYTFILGETPEKVMHLVKTTKESLTKGIEKAVHGNRIGDISYAIQSHVEQYGYGVVKELVGHGLGRRLHETPPEIPNYGKQGRGKLLKENLVVAIEPMINLGTDRVYIARDKWTIRTADGEVSAHFEHDVCIKKGTALVLTDFNIIEKEEKNNPNLNSLI